MNNKDSGCRRRRCSPVEMRQIYPLLSLGILVQSHQLVARCAQQCSRRQRTTQCDIFIATIAVFPAFIKAHQTVRQLTQRHNEQ